jgi:hypothetical protein
MWSVTADPYPPVLLKFRKVWHLIRRGLTTVGAEWRTSSFALMRRCRCCRGLACPGLRAGCLLRRVDEGVGGLLPPNVGSNAFRPAFKCAVIDLDIRPGDPATVIAIWVAHPVLRVACPRRIQRAQRPGVDERANHAC